jgi:YbbR domain-containing protein
MKESVPRKRTHGALARWIILPLLLGVATVALISRMDKRQTEIAIDVTFVNLGDNLLLLNAPPPSVRLLVSGRSSALESLDSMQTSCRVDLSGLGAGSHNVAVSPNDVHLPKGLSLSALLTPSLTVRLAPMSQKKVNVFAVLKGNPAHGYAVAGVRLTPDHIVIKGTAAMLADIDTVKTRPINLENASEPFKKEVPLNLPEAVGVDPPLRIVLADIEIKARIVTRVLTNVPVVAKGAMPRYRIQPDEITLTVRGPEPTVSAIETDPAFTVTVDLDHLDPGTHSLKAVINLPVHTTLVSASPERFSVTIGD